MKIIVNNQELETQASSLLSLAQELKLPEKGIAIAVNNHLIPRMEWSDYALQEGTCIVIIKAACGG
ncbi:ThiS, thiamine-biosynthesis [gut metagenome]|uniref:ThiS, thiamine-biosynthesis n=1 Tax=gut metagenome TaxID=749906 RepID=J9F5Q8_9ZZZZ